MDFVINFIGNMDYTGDSNIVIIGGGGGPGGVNIMKAHGWILWFAWGILGFIQFSSIRYLKMFPKVNLWIHIICGCCISILTIIMTFEAFKYFDWEFLSSEHAIIGFIVFVVSTFLTLAGFLTWGMMTNVKWHTSRIIKAKLMHKIAGYIIIFLGEVAIINGNTEYKMASLGITEDEGARWNLGTIHHIIFFFSWMGFEFIY